MNGFMIELTPILDGLGWAILNSIWQISIAAILVFLFYKIRNLIKTHQSFPNTFGRIGLSIVSFLMGTIFLFLLMWGFNYGRLPL